jgi:hypothetical protein
MFQYEIDGQQRGYSRTKYSVSRDSMPGCNPVQHSSGSKNVPVQNNPVGVTCDDDSDDDEVDDGGDDDDGDGNEGGERWWW